VGVKRRVEVNPSTRRFLFGRAAQTDRGCDKIFAEVTSMAGNTLTLQDIIIDIHALNEDLAMYERKYGVLSETFYESYQNGEEPKDDSCLGAGLG
jgi:hypothetical protein